MMLRNIWAKTLRDERGAVIGYGLGLALYGLLIVTMYPSIAQSPGFAEMIDSYPPAMKALIGEINAFATVEGFVSLEVLTWLPLILAIFAIMSATDFVAGEAERGTLDLVLSLPVRRWRLIAERMLALTCSLVAIAIVTALGVWIGLPFANVDMPASRIVLGTLAVIPLVLVIAGFSLFLGCLLMSRKRAGMIAAGLTVALYLVNSLSSVLEQLEPWSRLSPFHYYKAYETLSEGPNLANNLILIGAAVLLVVLSIVVFQRRDILTN